MKQSRASLIIAAVLVVLIARWNFLVAIGLAWLSVLVGGWVWRFRRERRAREEIRAALGREGYEIVHMKYRYWRTGPFSTWTTTSHNFVFRILVRQAGGAQRIVWAKWGQYWFGHPDTLELSWESETGY